MENIGKLPDPFTQNDKLPIRIVSPEFGHVAPEIAGQYGLTHRKPYYFFLFMLNGCTRHGVDLEASKRLCPPESSQVTATRKSS